MAAKKQSTKRYVLLANKSYGLYVGTLMKEPKMQPDGTFTAEVMGVRHVARWFGKTGGITSLAAHGLCGPSAGDSRIGAAIIGLSNLSGIVNIFDCSPEARASFEAAKQA